MTNVLLHLRPGRNEGGPHAIEQALASLRTRRFSLLIAKVGSSVRFLVEADERDAESIETSLYGQMPNAHIEKLDSAGREPTSGEHAESVHLRLRRPDPFPIRRHPQMLDASRNLIDPLPTLIAAIAQPASPVVRTILRIELEPMEDSFRPRATTALRRLEAREIQQAESLTDRYLRYATREGVAGLPFRLVAPGLRRFIPYPEDLQARLPTFESSASHDREGELQACLAKLQKHLFRVRMSVVAIGTAPPDSHNAIATVVASLDPYGLPHLNAFTPTTKSSSFALNVEELAGIWHFPATDQTHLEPTPIAVPAPPRGLPDAASVTGLSILGDVTYRGRSMRTGLTIDQKRRHVYCLGRSGCGKSTLLGHLISSDMNEGRGIMVADPHGDLIDYLLTQIPRHRKNDLVLIDPAGDQEHPVAYNPLACSPSQVSLMVDQMIATFYKIFSDLGGFGYRQEDILRYSLLLLGYAGESTLLDVTRLFDDRDFRNAVLDRLGNREPQVRQWWMTTFPALKAIKGEDPFASTANKLRALSSTPAIREMLGQPCSKLDLRFAMDTGKIVLLNLSKGKLGERASGFLGSIFLTGFQLAAMSRADVPDSERPDFCIYVDEVQSYATPALAEVVSEARKYHVMLTLAHQFAHQLPESLRRAIIANVGTIIAFQSGDDAELLAEQLGSGLTKEDLLTLPRRRAYVRTEFDGIPASTFLVQTLPPNPPVASEAAVAQMRQLSRERYATRAMER